MESKVIFQEICDGFIEWIFFFSTVHCPSGSRSKCVLFVLTE